MRENNLAAFPLKTNIVFISSNYNQPMCSYIQNLIMSVFYNTYKDETINISFQDKQFEVTLYTFLLTWMYIVFNKVDSEVLSISGNFINFNNTGITIEELDDILDEYNQLGNLALSSTFSNTLQTTFDAFYEKYFSPLKSTTSSSGTVLDKSTLNNLIKIENVSLINYIDNVLVSGESSIIAILMGDLVRSLEAYKKTSTDLDFIKYFRYFKSFLPTIDFIPSNNTVYKILYYMKPFHTDFLDLEDLSLIFSNDKFNNIYFEIFHRQGLLMSHSDVIKLETFYKSIFLEKATSDIAIISAKMGSFLKNFYTTEYDMLDEYAITFFGDEYTEDVSLSDDFILLFSPD
jgi:hypothetical protein